MMVRQPQRTRSRLLKMWLPLSLLSAFYLFSLPALGWEIDFDASLVPELSAPLDDVVLPEILDEWVAEPALARSEKALKSRRAPKGKRQARRAPPPSVETICASLKTTLPRFDLAANALPTRLRQRLCRRVRAYAVRYRPNVQATLRRADPHLPMIKRTLRQHELPTYYAYVPMVESAFRIKARHRRSGARGLWQLMRRTARAHGLTVSKAVDERLHPKRSTEAAARYLAYLHERFGEHGPLYVLAAYNYGETNLSRKMRRFRRTDVASLYRPGYLPAETREYLLRIMAMWVIAADPERFQLSLREAADDLSLDAASRTDATVGLAQDGAAPR